MLLENRCIDAGRDPFRERYIIARRALQTMVDVSYFSNSYSLKQLAIALEEGRNGSYEN